MVQVMQEWRGGGGETEILVRSLDQSNLPQQAAWSEHVGGVEEP